MKVFTKLGITILVVFITAGMLWAQSSYDIGPKKPIQPIASDAIFDLQFEWPVGVGGGEAGIETNGTYIYTTKWNGTGEYYRYGMDGSYIEQITIAGAAGTRDLAFDGTYFYGAAANTTVFQLDLDGASLVSTFSAPTDCRAIAYNEDDDAFYANNWGSNITKFDMAGTNLGSWAVGPVGDSYYGFAYDNYCSGTYLWGYAQVGASLSELVQMSLPDGAETGLTFDVGSVLSAVDMAGGMCIDDNLVSGAWTIMGTCQNVNIWGVELCASGPALTNDVGIQSISAPNSGVNLSSAESVTVNVKNYGTDAQSNFDVWFTLDGGTAVTETISVTINGGDTYAHTFGTTVDLSAIGDYDFEACTDLTGDENTGNDCATKTVSNNVPEYCAASTGTEDEWIMDVVCGDINNLGTAWQGGVADYTDISTTIGQGMSEDITIENGNAWASDIVYCWVDWNDDYVFEQGGNEEFQLLNVGGAGQTFTGAITAPADAIGGDHRMRVRMTYSTAPEPCGNSSYGEVEDYTITVPGGSTLDPPTNFVAVVQDAVNVYSTWDAPVVVGDWIQWDNGTNDGGIGLTSGGTLYTASHWFPADLADYDGMNITQISFFANGDPDATYELMAWTGPDAGTQIMSQPIASFTVDEYNEINLDTPITIDASDELWFGYSCTHLAGTLPAGRDGGPAIPNNGDMLSTDGTTWVSMFLEYGLDYNWNLAAFVVATDATFPAKPMVKSTISNVSNGSPVTNELPGSGKEFTPSSSKALIGFNVYNNVEFIGYTTETNHLHENVAIGTYDYWATAVYDEGESGPSNTDQVTISGGGPVALFCDDFESYNVGEQLVVQNSTDWTTWSNNPGSAEDPYIIDQDGNAVEITGTNDLVYVMPNYTAGVYKMTFDMYVPTGGDGYFNTLQEFDPTPTWGMQVYFGHTNPGEGNIDGGAALAQVFSFDYDTWMSIKVTVDLDADWGEFFLDDVLIHGWVWSSGTFGTGTLNQLGGNNFFAWDGGVNGNPDFYFDNYCLFEEGEPPPCFFFDDFEAYNVGEQLVVQNSTDWTTWSNNPGSAEDPYIADQDGNTVNITGTNDLVYVMPNYAAGYYEMSFDMYVPTGGDG
ncbi:MAG: hypothetical protein K8R74_07135, partial [Bacteroidales bacterium]|nr:hypothetical protein [Bacteroidales bacterium]